MELWPIRSKRCHVICWELICRSFTSYFNNVSTTKKQVLPISPKCPIASKTKMCIHHGGGKPAQACMGDSGGPLTVDRGGVRQVIGVASYLAPPYCSPIDIASRKCKSTCESENIAVYTKVQAYLPWIQEITGIGKFTRVLGIVCW